ncbi:DUF3515 domain-containing protein [Streptomyces sp. ISL-11]|uniref:DUF3515 domain-containing protein n=1 Tax=Streptomyces sp. ISL-11 TaxID=2819174 RepID=UPI001BEAE4D1|nr:DUF3515 domain-containing protein [Streptomyces sp. ISL-11]MBT2387108.1 DUF3515 domain-containing protein [Streptomyces sp. ISL-11]
MKSSLRRSFGLPAVVVLFAVAGCSSSDDAAGITVPTPSGPQAAKCRALHQELPATVDGLKRRATDPVSDFTAAWGEGPSVSLSCGVEKPEKLVRHPDADSMEIDGVKWMPEKQPDGSVRCTTVTREAWVRVTLPKKVVGDAGDMSALTDLTDAVRRTIPVGVID